MTTMSASGAEQIRELTASLLLVVKFWLRRLVRWATASYLAVLFLMCLAIHWHAETNILTAYCLYLPPMVAVLPLIFIALPSLWVCWRSLLAQSISVLLFIWLYMGYEFRGSVPLSNITGANIIKVATFSAGQTGGTKPVKFLAESNPDLVAVQDTGRHGFRYREDPDYQACEYLLMSRYPILSQELVHVQMETRKGRQDVAVAARFVVDWPKSKLCVYSVHMPTPRDILTWYTQRGTFLHGLAPFTEKHIQYKAYWQGRVEAAEKLSAIIHKETMPVVLMGDFNTPPHGETYHALLKDFTDGHRESGSGFGYTFPCSTWNPFAFFRPWLRLDQILASRHWRFKSHVNEVERTTQHRCIAAALSLKE
jgi:vancomycin resistance protein VanJ